jgi:hypothetical protein
VRRVERDRHRALVVRQPAEHRVRRSAEVCDGELLTAYQVVDRHLPAQAGGIGDGALLHLVALEPGGLEHPLLGDHVSGDALGQRVAGDEHSDRLSALVDRVLVSLHEDEQDADGQQAGHRREHEGALAGG